MCTTGRQPASVGEALEAVRAGLAYRNQVEASELPGAVQAGCLRELARAGTSTTTAITPDAEPHRASIGIARLTWVRPIHQHIAPGPWTLCKELATAI